MRKAKKTQFLTFNPKYVAYASKYILIQSGIQEIQHTNYEKTKFFAYRLAAIHWHRLFLNMDTQCRPLIA